MHVSQIINCLTNQQTKMWHFRIRQKKQQQRYKHSYKINRQSHTVQTYFKNKQPINQDQDNNYEY